MTKNATYKPEMLDKTWRVFIMLKYRIEIEKYYNWIVDFLE